MLPDGRADIDNLACELAIHFRWDSAAFVEYIILFGLHFRVIMAGLDSNDEFGELDFCFIHKQPQIQRQYAMCAGGATNYRSECMLEALSIVCNVPQEQLKSLLSTGMSKFITKTVFCLFFNCKRGLILLFLAFLGSFCEFSNLCIFCKKSSSYFLKS
jgi:hypothetical protein